MPLYDPEAEARKKKELADARAKRATQLKRGPGVAALVQGALKHAKTKPVVGKKEEATPRQPIAEKLVDMVDSDEESVEAAEKRRQQEREEAERKKRQAEREAQEQREKAEREAQERERREKARREAAEAEQALQKQEAETRDQRIKASVEAAKKQQAERAAAKARETDSLYSNMPQPNLEPETSGDAQKTDASAAEKKAAAANLPKEDRSKVVFLDVDGVLRPARAGGFDILPSDGDAASRVDTSDFFPSAVKALRHIIERTAATIVLTSEWRRSEALRNALSDTLEKNRMRPCGAMTTTDLQTESGPDPLRCFAERRAREISQWLRDHEKEVSGWVVLDDVNLSIVDEAKKQGPKIIGQRLVQTWPLCGLTMGNAKTAVRILNGEFINKVVVERPIAPEGAGSGTQTPMPGGKTR